MESVRIRSFSSPYFPALSDSVRVSLRSQSECSKTRTKKTPNKGTFHAVHFLDYFVLNDKSSNIFTLTLFYKELSKTVLSQSIFAYAVLDVRLRCFLDSMYIKGY